MNKEPGSRVCAHCGTQFVPRDEREHFCCAGCEYVHRLINEKELGRYYDLKDAVTAPVGTRIFAEDSWVWLEQVCAQAEAAVADQTNAMASVSVRVQGVACTACVWLLERIFETQEGAVDIRIDVRYGELCLWWRPGGFNAAKFANEVKALGYVLCPAQGEGNGVESPQSRALELKLGLCAAFAMNTMLASLPAYLGMGKDFFLAEILVLLAMLFSTLSMLVGGIYFVRRAWSSLRLRTIHMDVPIALGLVAAYVGSLGGWLVGREDLMYFDFVSIFVLLMLLGRWLQEWVLEHNRSRYLASFDLPREVTRIDADGPHRQDIEAIVAGQRLCIESGKMVPVAGRLCAGNAILNLQCINGEQEARELKPGELVPSGGLHCGAQAIEIETLEGWGDSLLARLFRQDDVAKGSGMLEQVLRIYLVVVMGVALMGGLYWVWRDGLVAALQVGISVLVVSCPCAIGVALPLLDEMVTVRLRRQGLYIRNAAIWGRLREVSVLAFDKTGTLTLERPALQNAEVLDALDAEARAVLNLFVRHSLHPLCRSLNQHLATRYGNEDAMVQGKETVEEVPGSGLRWWREGVCWSLGKPGWESPESEVHELVFTCDRKVMAGFRFTEQVREASQGLSEGLMREGYALAILSGDRDIKVKRLATALGIPEECVYAQQSPQDKADWIRAREGVLMVGDGLNDSLALSQAQCSGVVVTDLNVIGHKADFLIMGSALRAVVGLLRARRVRERGVRALFGLNVIYNLGVVSVALAGWMNPLMAAIVMPLSSVVSTLVAFAHARRA